MHVCARENVDLGGSARGGARAYVSLLYLDDAESAMQVADFDAAEYGTRFTDRNDASRAGLALDAMLRSLRDTAPSVVCGYLEYVGCTGRLVFGDVVLHVWLTPTGFEENPTEDEFDVGPALAEIEPLLFDLRNRLQPSG